MQKSPTEVFHALFPNIPGIEFLEKQWPDNAYWCDGDIGRLPNALKVPELQSIEALGQKYRGRVTFGNAKTSSRTVGVDHIGVEVLLRMGLSLYLPEIENTLPQLRELLSHIEAAVGAPPGSARAGIFIAPAENGVTCHFDPEEVFSIQLVGEKRFFIAKAPDIDQPMGSQYNPGDVTFDDMYPQCGLGFPNPDSAEFTAVDLKPGSALFMPRGTWHRTETSAVSMSLSIIIRPPSAMDCLLEVLHLRMLQDPAWRRPLHGAWGNTTQRQAAQDQVATLMTDLPQLIHDINIGDIVPTQLSEPDRASLIDPNS